MMPLRYLQSGHALIVPEDDCESVVDSMLETDYNEEFCLAISFDLEFINRLMEAGFLVMSMELKDDDPEGEAENGQEGADSSGNEIIIPDPFFILLPKLHLIRSVLFFPELKIKKNIRGFLSKYELRVNEDFDFILDKCVQIHGEGWLTPPLVDAIKKLHHYSDPKAPFLNNPENRAIPISFGVYREGELKAGEIGVIIGMPRITTTHISL